MKVLRNLVRITLLVLLGFGTQWATAQEVIRPLDSLIFAMDAMDIPDDLQEEWIEELEKYEDDQQSEEFKEALKKVQLQIDDYLVNGRTTPKPKPKKKKFFKNLGDKISAATNKVKEDIDVVVPLEIAKAAENNDNYSMAIKNYKIAISELEQQENMSSAIDWRIHLAELYETTRDSAAALFEWKLLQERMNKYNLKEELSLVKSKIAALSRPVKVIAPTPIIPPTPTVVPSVPTAPVTPTIIQEKTASIINKERVIAKAENAVNTIKQRAAQAEREKDYATSLQLNKQLSAMELMVKEQKILMEGDKRLLAENKLQLLEQEGALRQQQLTLAEERTFKRNLWAGLGLLSALLISLYFLYANKQRDHKKLGIAYKELATAQNHLKDAESRVKNLLKQQLSGAVANELMATGGVQKMEQRFVCIMFLDIRDFTPFVEKLSPEEIIAYQNNVLGFMIEKVIEHNGVVNTIMGDGFMATFGAPISVGNDCLQAHRAATEIMEMVKSKSETGAIPPTRIGIGLHAGYVVAGNVGTKERKQYSITGNAVIIASRLEQLNKEYKSTLIVSKEVFEQLPEEVAKPTEFDEVMVKGRSEPVEIASFA